MLCDLRQRSCTIFYLKRVHNVATCLKLTHPRWRIDHNFVVGYIISKETSQITILPTMTSRGVPVVPAVAAATAIIFFVLTAGQPTATAAIVEHTFIVSMTKFPCLLINLCKATEEYVCKLYMLGCVHICMCKCR